MAFDDFLKGKGPADLDRMMAPFSDDDARRMLESMKVGQKVNETQNAIIPYIKQMAAALAEAARASAEAGRSDPMIGRQIGVDPYVCLEEWIDVLRKEACRIIMEKTCTPRNGTRNETSTLSLPRSAPTTSSPQPAGSDRQAPLIESAAIKDGSSRSK